MLPERLELAVDPSFELADGNQAVRTTYSSEGMLELRGYSVTGIANSIVPIASLSVLSPVSTLCA